MLYRDFPHDAMHEGLSPSVESTGRSLDQLLTASRGPIPNFPPPAKVTWRSKDGAPHEAEIDIGEIFKDELVVHNTPRDEASERTPMINPDVIMEISDRTINVYMKAFISLKQERIPGNQHSNFRSELVLAWSRTY